MNILLIEDEILISKTISFIIKKKGHNIITTASGIEGIQYIKDMSFDRIITDLMLIDISGFDIIEECHNLNLKDIITVITAYNSPDIIKRLKQSNCNYYFKPFNNLIDTINKILEE